MSITVHATKIQALLRGQEWINLDDDSADLIGEMLRFEPETRFSYAGKNVISSLQVSGSIYSISMLGRPK